MYKVILHNDHYTPWTVIEVLMRVFDKPVVEATE